MTCAIRLPRNWLAVFAAMMVAGCSGQGEDLASPAEAASSSRRPATGASGGDAGAADKPAPVVIDRAAFNEWLKGVRAEALRNGISRQTVAAALDNVTPLPRVIELDRAQPEFTSTFGGYLSRSVNDKRVQQGRELLRQHGTLLAKVERSYGVQPEFLVAFWGLESNYGSNYGSMSVVASLATLAFEGRRASFFRKELMDALVILDGGHITPQKMVGSWAGAMGNLQFMPSTWRAHAVDGDGDRKIDIWNSLPDTFNSAAKYLSDIGWNGQQTWGREVRLPAGFNYELADLAVKKSLAEWQALGVTLADGRPLTASGDSEKAASLVVPSGSRGPAFVVYGNFRAIMQWNKSTNYALAVGILSDRLRGASGLVVTPEDGPGLRRSEVLELQQNLNRLGYAVGAPDGVAGSGTRQAVKEFQKQNGLVADAYINQDLLQAVRRAASRR